MGGGAWWATAHRVAKSWTRMSDFTHSLIVYYQEKVFINENSKSWEQISSTKYWISMRKYFRIQASVQHELHCLPREWHCRVRYPHFFKTREDLLECSRKQVKMTNLTTVYNRLSWSTCCCYLVTKSCLILWDPMDYSPPGSSVHGIFLAKILEWVAISFSRGSSRARDGTQISCIAGRFSTTEPLGKPIIIY